MTPKPTSGQIWSWVQHPWPMQPVKPGERFGHTLMGWCWGGRSWQACDAWHKRVTQWLDASEEELPRA